MPLDPKAEKLLSQMKGFGAPAMHTLSPESARKAQATGYAFFSARLPKIPVLRIEDRTIPTAKRDTPIRIYWPNVDDDVRKNGLPLFVFIHGGGWVLGDLDQYNDMCRRLSSTANCIVMSVDYGLAPEWKFPDPVEECYAALHFAVENADSLGVDKSRVALGGDSAGGNLAAAVALLARDRGEPNLCYQVLMYPATDMYGETESKIANRTGYFLEEDDMMWFRDCYLQDERDAKDPLASPLLAPDHHGLPPALVITAEYDPLHDEGEAYAVKLREAGVPAEHHNYEGMIHGFMSMTWVFDQAAKAIDLAATKLSEAFARD